MTGVAADDSTVFEECIAAHPLRRLAATSTFTTMRWWSGCGTVFMALLRGPRGQHPAALLR
jgi:hypothetical protein